MKKFALILITTVALVFGTGSTADAGVSFGFSIGHGGYYGNPYYGYHRGSYHPYPAYHYPRHRYYRAYGYYRPRPYYRHPARVYYGRICY